MSKPISYQEQRKCKKLDEFVCEDGNTKQHETRETQTD